MKFNGKISSSVALKLAAAIDEENQGVNTNRKIEFKCEECDGRLSYHRGQVTPHFEHQGGYADSDDVRRHTPC